MPPQGPPSPEGPAPVVGAPDIAQSAKISSAVQEAATLPDPDHTLEAPDLPAVRQDLPVGHPNRLPDEVKAPIQGPLTEIEAQLLEATYGPNAPGPDEYKIVRYPEQKYNLERIARIRAVQAELRSQITELDKLAEDLEERTTDFAQDTQTLPERIENMKGIQTPEEVTDHWNQQRAEDDAARASTGIIRRGEAPPIPPNATHSSLGEHRRPIVGEQIDTSAEPTERLNTGMPSLKTPDVAPGDQGSA